MLNDFLHDKSDADEASFLCLGMIVKIQEHINYFSNQFKEKYLAQLKQFKSDRNQIIHRENDSSLFYNQRDIYNWEKLFEIKATHASALLQSLLEIKQELLVNSQPLTNISYKK